MYYNSFLSFIQDKKSRIKPLFFSDLSNRYPIISLNLVPRIISSLSPESNLKSYAFAQTLEMIALILKRVPFGKSDEIKSQVEWISMITEISGHIQQAMTRFSNSEAPKEGPWAMSSDRIKDIIKSIMVMARSCRFVPEVKKSIRN